jgi:DNA-repair protein XRCC1
LLICHQDAEIGAVLDGVILSLSGYVNPERKSLRETAAMLGAVYRPDWSADCTHLICAFSKTPKIDLALRSGGVIVRGDWISECYKARRKLPEGG